MSDLALEWGLTSPPSVSYSTLERAKEKRYLQVLYTIYIFKYGIFAISIVAIVSAGNFSGGSNLGASTSLACALGDLDSDGDLDGFVGNSGVNKIWINIGPCSFFLPLILR